MATYNMKNYAMAAHLTGKRPDTEIVECFSKIRATFEAESQIDGTIEATSRIVGTHEHDSET